MITNSKSTVTVVNHRSGNTTSIPITSKPVSSYISTSISKPQTKTLDKRGHQTTTTTTIHTTTLSSISKPGVQVVNHRSQTTKPIVTTTKTSYQSQIINQIKQTSPQVSNQASKTASKPQSQVVSKPASKTPFQKLHPKLQQKKLKSKKSFLILMEMKYKKLLNYLILMMENLMLEKLKIL